MADIKQLEAALIKADAAGNMEDARILAAEIRRLRSNVDDGFSAKEMVKNIPSSAAKYAGDIASMVTNPKGTLQALGGAIESGMEYLNPGYWFSDETPPYRPVAHAIGNAVKDRYGSVDKALNTLETDPVGALADVSGAVTGVGATAKLPAVSKVGMALDPINAVTAPIKAGLSQIPRSVPAGWYQSAAKFPPQSVKKPIRDKITETALNEGIMPTGRGIDKVNDILGGLDEKIDNLIQAADATGKTYHRKVIYSDLKELRRELKGGAGEVKNLKQYRNMMRQIDEALKGGPERLTPSRLQEFKTKTYRDINWKGEPDAKTATMQATARGARKAIEDVTPEIKAVNQRYGPLAELRDRLPQVANRIDNHNPLSLTTGLLGTAGGTVGDLKGALAGVGLSMLNHPKVLAGAAITLRGLQNRGLLGNLVNVNPTAYAARMGLLQSGRLEGLE